MYEDGLAFGMRGYVGVGVTSRAANGTIPHYHLPSDTSDRVDWDVAWRTVHLARALLRAMGRA